MSSPLSRHRHRRRRRRFRRRLGRGVGGSRSRCGRRGDGGRVDRLGGAVVAVVAAVAAVTEALSPLVRTRPSPAATETVTAIDVLHNRRVRFSGRVANLTPWTVRRRADLSSRLRPRAPPHSPRLRAALLAAGIRHAARRVAVRLRSRADLRAATVTCDDAPRRVPSRASIRRNRGRLPHTVVESSTTMFSLVHRAWGRRSTHGPHCPLSETRPRPPRVRAHRGEAWRSPSPADADESPIVVPRRPPSKAGTMACRARSAGPRHSKHW